MLVPKPDRIWLHRAHADYGIFKFAGGIRHDDNVVVQSELNKVKNWRETILSWKVSLNENLLWLELGLSIRVDSERHSGKVEVGVDEHNLIVTVRLKEQPKVLEVVDAVDWLLISGHRLRKVPQLGHNSVIGQDDLTVIPRKYSQIVALNQQTKVTRRLLKPRHPQHILGVVRLAKESDIEAVIITEAHCPQIKLEEGVGGPLHAVDILIENEPRAGVVLHVL
jgi:hypothetical protein